MNVAEALPVALARNSSTTARQPGQRPLPAAPRPAARGGLPAPARPGQRRLLAIGSVAEQRGQRLARIGRAHERLADQERMHAGGAHALHVGRRAGCRDSVTSRRSAGTSRQQRRAWCRSDHLEGAQVAVVDADQRRLAACSARSSSSRVVHFDQHRHAELARDALRARAICASSSAATISRMQSAPIARASYTWYGSIMKSLRSTGSVAGGARLLQVVGAALEEMRVGQHRQAGRAVARRSSARWRPGSKSARSTPLLGLAFFISAITAGLAGRDLARAARPRSRACARGCRASRRASALRSEPLLLAPRRSPRA